MSLSAPRLLLVEGFSFHARRTIPPDTSPSDPSDPSADASTALGFFTLPDGYRWIYNESYTNANLPGFHSGLATTASDASDAVTAAENYAAELEGQVEDYAAQVTTARSELDSALATRQSAFEAWTMADNAEWAGAIELADLVRREGGVNTGANQMAKRTAQHALYLATVDKRNAYNIAAHAVVDELGLINTLSAWRTAVTNHAQYAEAQSRAEIAVVNANEYLAVCEHNLGLWSLTWDGNGYLTSAFPGTPSYYGLRAVRSGSALVSLDSTQGKYTLYQNFQTIRPAAADDEWRFDWRVCTCDVDHQITAAEEKSELVLTDEGDVAVETMEYTVPIDGTENVFTLITGPRAVPGAFLQMEDLSGSQTKRGFLAYQQPGSIAATQIYLREEYSNTPGYTGTSHFGGAQFYDNLDGDGDPPAETDPPEVTDPAGFFHNDTLTDDALARATPALNDGSYDLDLNPYAPEPVLHTIDGETITTGDFGAGLTKTLSVPYTTEMLKGAVDPHMSYAWSEDTPASVPLKPTDSFLLARNYLSDDEMVYSQQKCRFRLGVSLPQTIPVSKSVEVSWKIRRRSIRSGTETDVATHSATLVVAANVATAVNIYTEIDLPAEDVEIRLTDVVVTDDGDIRFYGPITCIPTASLGPETDDDDGGG